MKTRFLLSVLFVTLLAFLAPGVHVAYATPSTSGYEIKWWSVAGGGGQDLMGGAFSLHGTAGQSDAGATSSKSFSMNSGFWVAADFQVGSFGYKLYLPLIQR